MRDSFSEKEQRESDEPFGLWYIVQGRWIRKEREAISCVRISV
jgi:hypothetical protein